MADKTVTFTGKTVLASVPQNLYYRINVIFAAGGANPAVGSTITYANLLSLYYAAKTALSTKGQTPSFTLSNFQNALLKAGHGIGIVEKTVGQLENTCPTYFSSNRSSAFDANFSSFGNGGNCSFFSGNFSSFGNSGNCSFFSGNFSSFGNGGNKAQHSSNFSSFGNSSNHSGFNGSNFSGFGNGGNKSFNSSNFSWFGNSGNNSGFRGSFNYQVFHFRTGSKATVHSGNNKANHSGFGSSSGNCSQRSSNFSSFGNGSNRSSRNNTNFSSFGNGGNKSFNSANFSSFGNSGNCSQYSSNFSSFGNSGNCSQYSSNFSSFGNGGNRSSLFTSNFSAVTKTCYVVHSTFRVEGVDF